MILNGSALNASDVGNESTSPAAAADAGNFCGINTAEDTFLKQSKLVFGYLIYVAAGAGVLGNLITIKVLSRPRLADCFHKLLYSLAVFDTIFLVFGSLKYLGVMHNHASHLLTLLYSYLTHPVTEIGMSGTIFSTVAITLERYLGICHPLDLPAYRRKPGFYMTPVTILAIGVNLPRFFESEPVYHIIPGTNDTELKIVLTNLRSDENYVLGYLVFFRATILAFIPFALLLVLNIRIIVDLRRVTVQRFGSPQSLKKEKNLYFVLLSLVVVFLVLQSPRLVVDIYEVTHYHQILECGYMKYHPPIWISHLLVVSNFFVIFNSSINFLLYCSVGTSFRKEWLSLVNSVQTSVFNTQANSTHQSTNSPEQIVLLPLSQHSSTEQQYSQRCTTIQHQDSQHCASTGTDSRAPVQ